MYFYVANTDLCIMAMVTSYISSYREDRAWLDNERRAAQRKASYDGTIRKIRTERQNLHTRQDADVLLGDRIQGNAVQTVL